MTPAEVDAFLQEPVELHLACLLPSGEPYATVCWHEWDGEGFWVVPRARALWAECLAADPRVSFLVHREQPHRKVTGQGLAELVERPNVDGRWAEVAQRMSLRYMGLAGASYSAATSRQPRWLFRIRATSMKTWQGEGWHRRYWVEAP
jgi:pyridoxine/pyridoxamine 5'-phosphate oxidase